MTYQVFLKNEYVRDAQGYLHMQLPQTDNEDIFDDKHENGWSDVSGDMLLMELHDTTYQDVVNRLQTLYSDADFKVFRITSIIQTEQPTNIIDAEFVYEYEEKQVCVPCKINMNTKEVFDIADTKENCNNYHLEKLFVLINNTDYPVFSADGLDEDDNETFWYDVPAPAEMCSDIIDIHSSLSDIVDYCKNKEERHASCVQCPLRKSYSTKQPDCCLLHMIQRPSDLAISEKH